MQNNRWLFVDTPSEVEEAVIDIGSSSLIGVDTEYDSFRYFREKLCLIQIKAKKKTYLFDPLGDLDISLLGEYFASPDLCKIMHAGGNDIRILKRDYDFTFQNIFDTHRAASLLGCSQLSLARVVGHYLGIEFEKNKQMQRSRWDLRPLTEAQRNYAVGDTAYLIDLYRRLKEEMLIKGLDEEAAKVFADMTMTRWRKKGLDKEGHKKVERYYSLTIKQQGRLKHLFRWRYGKAKEIDRAIFMILSDKDMIRLSGLEICSLSDLMASRILPTEKLHLFGAELVELLKKYEGNAGCLS